MQKVIFKNNMGQSITLSNTRPFILEKIQNTGGVKSTLITTKAPYQDGKSYHGSVIEDRIIPITGAIVGENQKDIDIKKKELCKIFNNKCYGELIYINNAGEYKIKCVVESSPVFNEKIGTIQKFLIQLYCPSPYWSDIEENKTEIALWSSDFEFPIEIPEEGINLGHRESNLIVNINNTGDVECGLRAELKALATVKNPSIFNIETREFIKVKKSLHAGDILIISTEFANKKVELLRGNGLRENVFNYIDLNSDFFQLVPGENLLRYDAEEGIDNLELSIFYKNLYLGV